jgi:flagellar biosynthesis/type III secretory pathway protein FliH
VERARLMSKYKYVVDTQSKVALAKREGKKEGLEEGMQKGIQKGMREKTWKSPGISRGLAYRWSK